MIPILIYLLKAVLCSGLLYGYYTMALRNRIFHQWNRFYLIAAVLFSLLFPLLSLPVFYGSSEAGESVSLQRLLVFEGDAMIVHSGKASVDWQSLASVVYVLVACFMALRFVMGLWQIKKLLQRSPSKQLGAIKFVTTGHAQAPFTFFHWLFWKKELPFDSPGGQSVFRHELVHIKEGHSLDKLLLQIVLIIFWMNPFFWIIRRELQMIHEFIADKKSVGNEGTEALAAMIMQSVYGAQYNHFINPFFQQPIKRRLTMLHKTLNQPRVSYLGRILALPLCTILLFAFAEKELHPGEVNKNFTTSKPAIDTIPSDSIAAIDVNTKDSTKTITITYKNGKKETYTEKEAREKGILKPPPPPPPLANTALVVIDGKIKGNVKELGGLDNLLKPEEIESINVLKDDYATKKYGAKGENGVIEIKTKTTNNKSTERQDTSGTSVTISSETAVVNNDTDKRMGETLVVIDEVLKGKIKDFAGSKIPLQPEQIESMNVLKGKDATTKYGEKGKEGVIEIKTKKGKQDKSAMDPRPESNIVFGEVEDPPTFPGGATAWRKFLEQNLNPSVPVDNGAPAGVYKTVTEFKVAPDGTLSEFQSLTKHAYGMEEESIKLLQKSPKWIPAKQNGKIVTALHKQPITFIISED